MRSAPGDGVGEAPRRRVDSAERRVRRQRVEPGVEVGRRAHAPRRVDAGEHRRHAGREQLCVVGNGPADDVHQSSCRNGASSAARSGGRGATGSAPAGPAARCPSGRCDPLRPPAASPASACRRRAHATPGRPTPARRWRDRRRRRRRRPARWRSRRRVARRRGSRPRRRGLRRRAAPVRARRRRRRRCYSARQRSRWRGQRSAVAEPQAVGDAARQRLALAVDRVVVQQHLDLVLPAAPERPVGTLRQQLAQRAVDGGGQRLRGDRVGPAAADEPVPGRGGDETEAVGGGAARSGEPPARRLRRR